jgi:hypothetical protein
MLLFAAASVLCCAAPAASAALTSPPPLEVFLAPGATADEAFAAGELAGWIGNATTGSPLQVSAAPPPFGGSSGVTLAVGWDAATAVGMPPGSLDGLGNESFVVSSNTSGMAKGCIAVSGGKRARRGALYGAYHLLKAWGFRFYAPTETVVPKAAALMAVAALPINTTYRPAMEFRSLESFETNGGGDQASNHAWSIRNHGSLCVGQIPGGKWPSESMQQEKMSLALPAAASYL